MLTDANFKQLLSHHPARQLLSISTQLSIEKLGETEVLMLDGNRILVPKGARKNIIRELHCAPSGLTKTFKIWSEWRLTVIAATVRIALVDILDLSEVVIPAGVFLHPAVGWG